MKFYFDHEKLNIYQEAIGFVSCLDVLFVKKHMTEEKITQGKKLLMPIISMLTGLIKTTSPHRVYEGEVKYNLDRID